MPKSASKLVCHPLTLDRWDDFCTLFGPKGACAGCWCMLWRLKRSAFDAGKGDGNRAAMHQLVKANAEPGILGYFKNEPVAWCAVAPREDYPALERSRVLKPIDDAPVWSISCLFIRRDCRRQGFSVAMLKAAIDFVKKRGGTMLEGYPVEPRKATMPDVFAWTGVVRAFEKAGFVECARHSETRPIMRYSIKKARPSRARSVAE